jgi:hypothetical protein
MGMTIGTDAIHTAMGTTRADGIADTAMAGNGEVPLAQSSR